MLFNKELNNNKLISINLKFIKSFIVSSQFDSIKLIKFAKIKFFKMMKIFLYIAILKQKRKDYNINLKKLLIKMLQAALLIMLANKNSKTS